MLAFGFVSKMTKNDAYELDNLENKQLGEILVAQTQTCDTQIQNSKKSNDDIFDKKIPIPDRVRLYMALFLFIFFKICANW